MNTMIVKLFRYDRYPWFHAYGDAFDRQLDELVGGPQNLDRNLWPPTGTVKGTKIGIELYEDGPQFQFVIEQIPNFLNAIATLVIAWCTWKNMEKPDPNSSDTGREMQIKLGEHFYKGKPKTKEEQQKILEFFKELAAE